MTNQYPGLARGPIDHQSSSVINAIANNEIDMGSSVRIHTTIIAGELLPRVNEDSTQGLALYGVVVGGDVDGIYGDGSNNSGDDDFLAANTADQGVVVVTQGRCLARVIGATGGTNGNIGIGTKLTQSATAGVLEGAGTSDSVIATLLQPVSSGDTDMVAIDIQREGIV